MCYDGCKEKVSKGGDVNVKHFLGWCNQANPQSDDENMIIRYGAELLIDNVLKIIILLVLGFILGKGRESVVFLLVFCSLRLKAGGFHAKTEWGCSLCMLLVWTIGILAAELIRMPLVGVLVMVFFMTPIIIWKAPKTINRHCYTLKEIIKAKIYAILILCACVVIASISVEWRSLIMFAVTLEVMTLLPD